MSTERTEIGKSGVGERERQSLAYYIVYCQNLNTFINISFRNMPHRGKGIRCQYDPGALQAAVDAVKSASFSFGSGKRDSWKIERSWEDGVWHNQGATCF